MKNVSNIFFKEDLLYGLNVYSNNDINIYNKDLIDLIAIHLNEYYNEILNISKKINDNLINEEQIINYLNNNKQLKEQYKKVFEDEISIVKKCSPDIVESWVYYKKFNQQGKY